MGAGRTVYPNLEYGHVHKNFLSERQFSRFEIQLTAINGTK